MHPKIKALLERLGKTLEQVKTDHPDEYRTCLEGIADEQATIAAEAARVPGLQADVTRLEGERDAANNRATESAQALLTDTRTRMVDSAIDAAELPEIEPYQDGDTTVDLAGEWRTGLVESAVAAKSDAEAQALVKRQIGLRQHMLGGRQTESAGRGPQRPATPPAGRPAPKAPALPVGEEGNEGEGEHVTEDTDIGDLGPLARLRS